MPTEIASLYATIGADTSGLKKALQAAVSELSAIEKKLDGTGKTVEGAEKSTASFGKTLGTVKGQALAAAGGLLSVVAAGKKLYDWGKQGAALEQTAESFKSMGVNLDGLRAASRGTVDDNTLMAQSMTLLAGTTGDFNRELASSLPRLLEIAKASNKLNPTLGETDFLFQSLATGVKRESKLIVDNTGIVFSQADAYAEYADQLGKSASQLTDTEKKLAFLNKTLEVGGTLIDQAGGDVDSLTDSYAKLETSIDNVLNKMKTDISKDTGRWAEFWNTALFGESMANEQYDAATALAGSGQGYDAYLDKIREVILNSDNGPAISSFIGAYNVQARQLGLDSLQGPAFNKNWEADFNNALNNIKSGLVDFRTFSGAGETHDILSISEYEMRANTELLKELGYGTHITGDAAFEYAQQMELAAQKNTLFGDSLDQGSRDMEEFQKQFNEKVLNDYMLGVQENMTAFNMMAAGMSSGIGPAMDDYNEQNEDLNEHLKELQAELADLEGTQGDVVTVQNRNALSAEELQYKTLKLAEAQERYNKALEKGDELGAAKAAMDAEKLGQQIAEGSAGPSSYVTDNQERIDELNADIASTMGAIGELEAEYQRQIGQFLMDVAMNNALADGIISDEEIEFIAALGESYGVLDERGSEALRNLNSAMDDVREGIIGSDAAIDGMQLKLAQLDGTIVNVEVWTRYFSSTAHNQQYDAQAEAQRQAEQQAWENSQPTPGSGAGGTPHFAQGGFLPAGANGIMGEEGPEFMRATSAGVEIIPMSGGRGGRAGGATWTGNIIIQGGDPRATADAVVQQLTQRGLLPRNTLR